MHFFEVKQAWSTLRKRPSFIFNISFTIALTLGVLLCALTLIQLMLFKPLPYPDQDQLFVLNQQHINQEGQHVGQGFSYPAVDYFYQHQSLVEQVSLNYYIADVISSLEHQPKVNTTYVSHHWFTMLDIPMALGQGFSAEHSVNKHLAVAVISHQMWKEHFNLSPGILGQSIEIRGTRFNIIGVSDESFIEPEIFSTGRQTQVWLAWDYNWTAQMGWGQWGKIDDALRVLVKLDKSTSQNQYIQRFQQLFNDYWQQFLGQDPTYQDWQNVIALKSIASHIYGDQQTLIYYIFFGCLGVFFIATANITNLFVSKTVEQQRTLAIHAAVGATKFTLARILFLETGLLMLIALPVSLAIAYVSFEIMQFYLANVMPRAQELKLSLFSVGCALVILFLLNSFFTAVCTSLVNYRRLANTLSSSGKGSGIQVKQKVRQSLIAIQVAIATSLIFINVTMFEQAYQLINTPIGIHTERNYQLRLAAKTPATEDNRQNKQQLREIRDKLMQHPNIAKASVSLSPLIWTGHFPTTDPVTQRKYTPESKFVDHSYFDILSQPLLFGRNFTEYDIKDGNKVVIVNEIFAQQLTGNTAADALGKPLHFFGAEYRIIGIVKGIQLPLERDIPARRYSPDPGTRPNIMIQTTSDIELSREQVQRMVAEASSQFTIFDFRPFDEDKNRLFFNQYTTLTITGLLTLVTIFLAAIGLYGVLNYSCQMRRYEIGTRMAIGAKPRDIVTMIIKDNSYAILSGICLASLVLVMGFVFFGVGKVSGETLNIGQQIGVTLLVIMTISMLACYLPLRQFITQPTIHSLRASE